MGGCVSQHHHHNSNQNDRVRLFRQGNLTFHIHGKIKVDRAVTGIGCKRTPVWETNLTKSEISLKIKEFWETRVDGSPKFWEILKQACDEPDCKKAEHLVKSSGLNMAEGHLLLSYDERGHRYELPPYVINPALKYKEEGLEAHNEENIPDKTFDLIFRYGGDPDCKVTLKSTESIQKVKKIVLKSFKSLQGIRLFFHGKEMNDEHLIGEFPVSNNVVVQVFPKSA